jgi:hypothetical protein
LKRKLKRKDRKDPNGVEENEHGKDTINVHNNILKIKELLDINLYFEDLI